MYMISLNHTSPKIKVNYGLQLLRMIMSFWVVLNHCYKTKNNLLYKIIFGHRFHVPTFIFISFYFFYKNISIKNIDKMKVRLEKLFLPYLIYPIFIWLLNYFLLIKSGEFRLKVYYKSLIIQFLIGRGVHGILWFHFNLILLTILFYIIAFIFNEQYLFILQILAIITYFLQYSKLNFKYFKKYNNNITFSVGYFVETYPLAVTGLTFSSLNLITTLQKYRFKSLFFSIIFIVMLFKYNIFTLINGFGKQGLMLNIGSLLFFIFFYLLPIEQVKIPIINYTIRYITNYTAGIYFLHIFIYKILKNYITLIYKKTLLGCIIIYITCYLICLICYNKFKYSKLKYLFI